MDKTMEIVIVLMVLMLSAVIIIAFVTNQTGAFSDFTKDTNSNAKCSLWEAQYERKYCSGNTQDGSGSTLEDKISNNCGGTPNCNDEGEVVIN